MAISNDVMNKKLIIIKSFLEDYKIRIRIFISIFCHRDVWGTQMGGVKI